jgi:hypothetical protein
MGSLNSTGPSQKTIWLGNCLTMKYSRERKGSFTEHLLWVRYPLLLRYWLSLRKQCLRRPELECATFWFCIFHLYQFSILINHTYFVPTVHRKPFQDSERMLASIFGAFGTFHQCNTQQSFQALWLTSVILNSRL